MNIHSFPSSEDKLIQLLGKKLEEPLPGKYFQYLMAHESEAVRIPVSPDNPRQASVLILLYPKNEAWNIVFIKRTSNKKGDRHSGQISFPGGKQEKEDSSFAHTALRETEEEIGIQSDKVQLLGSLTNLYIPVSNFEVHPFIGFTNEEPLFIPQPSEVDAIIETPLERLLSPSTKQQISLQLTEKIVLPKVPCFKLDKHIVWGATAMILNEFLSLLHSSAE